jgi:cytoskeletal protein RodZ
MNENTEQNSLSFGAYIQSLRHRKDISLEEIANKTKINLSILKNLEKEATQEIPKYTYIKGFTELYLRHVDAKTEEKEKALALLTDLYQTKKTTEENSVILNQKKNIHSPAAPAFLVKNLLFNKKLLISLLVLLILIPTYYYFSKIKNELETSKAINNKKTEVATNKIDTSSLRPEPSKPVEQNTEINTDPELDSQDKNSIENTTEIALSDTPSGPSEIKQNEAPIETKNEKTDSKKREFYRFNTSNFKLIDDPANEAFEFLPEKARSIDTNRQNVFIKAVDGDSWLAFKVGESAPKTKIVKQGEDFNLSGEQIFLFLGNFKAVRLFYNNQYIETNTKSNVLSFVFPLEQAKNHYRPLFLPLKDGRVQFYLESDAFKEFNQSN